MKKIYLVLLTLLSFVCSQAQIAVTVTNPTNTTPALAATYSTLAGAITALSNITAISGPITLTCAASATETAPAGGYVISFTAATTATNNVVITGSASIITAFTPQASGVLVDAIFKIIGSDFVTLQGFTMQENSANTTTAAATNNMTEFGVALFYASLTNGAQNNTIQNNTISLNRTNLNSFGIYSNTRHSSIAVTTSAEVTSATGSNSGNKVYSNLISNVNYGIVFIGAGTTIAAIDNGNDIGGFSVGTGNTITNWGGGAAFSSYVSLTGSNYAIFNNQQINDNISFNTITSASLAQLATTGGILKNYSVGQPTGTITTSINNNTVTIINNPTFATTGGIVGINNQGLTPLLSTATMSMNNNTVQNCVLGGSTSTTNGIIGITNLSLPGTMSITGNSVLNNTITATTATTGGITAIANSGAVTTLNMTNNIVISNSINTSSSTSGLLVGMSNSGAAGTVNMNTNIIRSMSSTAASGQIQGIMNSGAVVTAVNINNNQLGNITSGFFTSSVASSGTLFGISSSGGASTCATSIQTNDIRGITYSVAASASQTYITSTGTPLTNIVANNTFTNLNVNTTGSVLFITISYTGPTNCTKTVNANSIITGFTKGGVGGSNYLVYDNGSTTSGSVSNCTNNNFSNITLSGATTFTGFYYNDGGTAPSRTVTGNILNNWATGASAIIGMNFNYWNGASTLSNNTITNINSQGAITGVTIGSSVSTATSITINANTINNLSSTGTGGAVTGIACSNASTLINISGHTIFGLSSTGASAVSGIIISGAGAGTNVFKNKIYNISGSNASSTVNGILVSAGTTINLYNNLIGALTTPAANAANPLIGLNITGGTTVNAYYNTVLLSASSTGALFGSSAVSVASAPTVTMRNNIFVNKSSFVGATGFSVAHRRSSTTLTTYAAASNNNLFYAGIGSINNLIYNDGTNSDQTMAAYKTRVSSRDASSITEDAPFVSTIGSDPTFLHINTSTPTQIESGGTTISGITDDYDSDVRNASTPDIGADEFTGVGVDITGPSISYTTISNTACGTDRTLVATISDASGVNIAAGTRPRLYFKKLSNSNTFNDNTNATDGWKYVEATGTGSSPFSFTTAYSLINGGVISGDNIQYFVVAQDLAGTPNIGYNSGVFAANPSSVALTASAFPLTGTINQYSIIASSSTDVTIGATGTYTSLTGTTGLFNAINNGGLSNNISANIIDPSVTETGAIALNQIVYGCAGTYTLTIKPASGVTSVLTGALGAGATIKLNGADNVIIDGSNNGTTSRDLTIQNTTTTTSGNAVIWIASPALGNGANNNIIKNSIIEGNLSTTTFLGVYIGGSTTISLTASGAEVNNTNTITNNLFRKTQYGIAMFGYAATLPDNGNIISNNNFGTAVTGEGFSIEAIHTDRQNNLTISGNDVQNIRGAFSNNIYGMRLLDFKNSLAFNNKIHNLAYTGTSSSYRIYGFAIQSSSYTTISNPSISTIYNNFIYDITSSGTSSTWNLTGMYAGQGYGDKYYYNSINLTGQLNNSTTGLSAAFANGDENAISFGFNLDVRNNIFNIEGTSGGGNVWAYYSKATSLTGTIQNYNVLRSAGTGATNNTARLNAISYTTLATWQTASGQEVNSAEGNPQFTSTTNLHINTGLVSSASNTGTSIAGITSDIDGDVRSASTPDIGADEFTVIGCTGQPNAGVITPSLISKCVGQTYTMSATGLSTGVGLTMQWQVASVSGGPYTNVTGGTGANTTSYTTATLTTGIYYYILQTTCSTSGLSNSTNELTLTVNNLPIVAVTPSSASFCSPGGSAIALTASGASTYSWSPTGGITPTTGTTVAASPTSTTTYIVTGTDVNGCVNTANSLVTVNPAPIITSVTATPTTVCNGGSTQLQVNVASSVVKITEVTIYRTGTGATVAYPAYITGADLVELSNLSATSVDISGFTLSDYGNNTTTISHPYTFPVGTIIPSNGVAVVHLGTGTDDIANRYYNAGGTSDSYSSGANVGIVLKAGTQVLDAVGLNTGYIFNAGTGVTAADWSGIASSPSGFAGTIRTAATDGNTGSDWTASSAGSPQTIGTYNGGYTPVSSSFTYNWSPATGLNDPTIANPLASNITANTTYTVSVSNGTCTSTSNVAVTLATYNTSVITQPSTSTVTAGSVNNQVILIDIPQACTAEALTQFNFTNASSVPTDVSSAKVYYTSTNVFSTTTLFGTTGGPTANFVVTGSQTLSTSTHNYFWLVFDIACNAGNTNVIDAGITSFIVGAGTYTPTPSNPTGTRSVTGLATLINTVQPSTATVAAGSINQQVVRVEIPATACGPLTNLVFNTNGSTNAATDISKARVYYTTSTTFATTTQFGTDVVNPNGSINISGSQTLSTTLSNYFWLVYDINCAANAVNVVDAEINSVTTGGSTFVPTTINPTGNRAISVLYAPTRTDGNSTTAVQLGTQNAPFVYSVISGSAACAGSVTTVNFTATNANATDVVNAKCYYTTTSTFSNAVQFGTSIANPATGAQAFTGSQLLASGSNYFWVVYDINCSGTVGASLNADINSLVVNSATIAVTGTVTATNSLAAITSFTTVADGEWNNTATWACGNVPLTNTTAVIIANNITVSNTGNIGGSVTINSGKSLTINSGGVLTLGVVGGGNRVLSNNGTLAVTGGTLNQNGSIVSNSGSYFNQSGGNINIDGNAAGVTANSTASGTSILQFNQLNSGINLTGGTLTIVDPHASSTANTVIGVNNSTAGIQTSTVNHTLQLGDGVSTDAGGNIGGFIIDSWTGTEFLSFGNIVINGASGTNRTITSTYQLAAVGDININASSTLNTPGIIFGRNLVVLALGTFINTGTVSAALIASNTSGTLIYGSSTLAQNITNSGTIANASTSSTANLSSFTVSNSNVSGITLNTPISISGTLTMAAGRINTDATNLLTLGYNATNAGTLTYTAGYINGPFKRWITAATGDRVFPLGNATVLKNASINFSSAPTTAGTLTARWSSTAPNFPNASSLMEGSLTVSKVSSQGSWFIDAADGLAGGTYTATLTANGSSDVVDYTKTVLVKRPSTGGDWTLNGTHVTTTGSNTAPVLSRTGMIGFSEFAIGGAANSVLPVTIEFFRGSKQATANYLDWKVTCTSAPSVQLSLERSADGRNFTAIDDQTATAARCFQGFNYTDKNPLAGFNYYRLKTTSPDGKFGYSTIVVLLNKEKGFELISLAPNPVQNSTTLTLTSVKGGKIELSISDVTGKAVAKYSTIVIAGNNPINMNFAHLDAGTYIITAVNADGDLKTIRFVKY